MLGKVEDTAILDVETRRMVLRDRNGLWLSEAVVLEHRIEQLWRADGSVDDQAGLSHQ